MTDIKNVDKYQQALNKYNLNITDAEVAEEVKKIVEKQLRTIPTRFTASSWAASSLPRSVPPTPKRKFWLW